MDRLTASEAIYGVLGWLTTRPTLAVFGASVNSYDAAEAADTYIKAQGLAAPRAEFNSYLNPMPAEDDDTPEALLAQWEAAKEALDRVKAVEARLRKNVIDSIYKDGLNEGANTIELGDGVKLTATGKVNYNLDKDSDKVEKVLDKLEKAGPEGKLLADRLVSWKPSLAVGEYRQLDDKYRKIIDTVVTTSPGTPSLEIKRPK